MAIHGPNRIGSGGATTRNRILRGFEVGTIHHGFVVQAPRDSTKTFVDFGAPRWGYVVSTFLEMPPVGSRVEVRITKTFLHRESGKQMFDLEVLRQIAEPPDFDRSGQFLEMAIPSPKANDPDKEVVFPCRLWGVAPENAIENSGYYVFHNGVHMPLLIPLGMTQAIDRLLEGNRVDMRLMHEYEPDGGGTYWKLAFPDFPYVPVASSAIPAGFSFLDAGQVLPFRFDRGNLFSSSPEPRRAVSRTFERIVVWADAAVEFIPREVDINCTVSSTKGKIAIAALPNGKRAFLPSFLLNERERARYSFNVNLYGQNADGTAYAIPSRLKGNIGTIISKLETERLSAKIVRKLTQNGTEFHYYDIEVTVIEGVKMMGVLTCRSGSLRPEMIGNVQLKGSLYFSIADPVASRIQSLFALLTKEEPIAFVSAGF